MNVQPVASANVTAVGYDEPSLTLEVHFSSGAIYQYFDLPRSTYDDLMNAPSKGQYFNLYIRNNYRYMRL